MDLEPFRLGSAAGQISASNRFFGDPFLGQFLNLFLLAFPGLLGRSKTPLGRPLDDFIGILAPEWVPKWRTKWVTERFRCEQQR